MTRHDPVVVIGCRYQRRRITGARLDVLDRGSVIRNGNCAGFDAEPYSVVRKAPPVELVEPQHVHDADGRQRHQPKRSGRCSMTAPTSSPPLDPPMMPSRAGGDVMLLLHEFLGDGDEVGEDVFASSRAFPPCATFRRCYGATAHVLGGHPDAAPARATPERPAGRSGAMLIENPPYP